MHPAAPPTASHALPTLPAVLVMVAGLLAIAISAPPAGLAAVPSAAATHATPPDLESRLRARIAEAPGEVGLALVDLETGLRIGIGDTVRMHAASTMKVPVMLELYRQAAAGEFSIDGTMVVRNAFRSIADRSDYSLSPESDSDEEIYTRVGGSLEVRDLIDRMITRSSNLATNLLIERADPERIRATLTEIGAEGMEVLRGVEDLPAFRQGLNNTTTALAFARVLEHLARCERGEDPRLGLSPAACAEMTDVLAGQHFLDKIPAGLPDGVRVANKTGWITGIDHDGAIVYPPDRAPYVLVVLTRGFEERATARATAADLSRIVWEELVGPGVASVSAASRNAVRPTASVPATNANASTASARPAHDGLALHARHRVDALAHRKFTHAEYWAAVGPIVDASPVLSREEVGRSVEGRPIYRVSFGSGPVHVLLWSQMHGNESTATMALADLFRHFSEAPDDARVRRLGERLTLHFVPMLNPDGVERFERRNAIGIDINRDARALATPEGRTLKSLQERYRPAFGFNLHDQNVRTRVGRSDRTAAIALLAPPPNGTGEETEALARATRLAAVLRHAVEPLVPEHIARYDDTFNPRAFGDLMQQWGVSTVLVESGGWRDDPEKQYLRAVNFVALLEALDAIATGAWADADPADYHALEMNGRAANDLLIHGGTVVVPGREPFRADLAVDFDEPLRLHGARLVDVGDLRETVARDSVDASGLYLHLAPEMLSGDGVLRPGARPVDLVIRRGADPGSPAVWRLRDGRAGRGNEILP